MQYLTELPLVGIDCVISRRRANGGSIVKLNRIFVQTAKFRGIALES